MRYLSCGLGLGLGKWLGSVIKVMYMFREAVS